MISDTGGLYCSVCRSKVSAGGAAKKEASSGVPGPKAPAPGKPEEKTWEKAVQAGPPKILLADDEPHIATLIKNRLEANRYRVITAADGLDAYQKIKSEKPDLILLDILMPGMSGYEMMEKFREEMPGGLGIPVIMISARPDMKSFFEPWEYVRFFPKPFDPDELMKAVEEIVGKPQ